GTSVLLECYEALIQLALRPNPEQTRAVRRQLAEGMAEVKRGIELLAKGPTSVGPVGGEAERAPVLTAVPTNGKERGLESTSLGFNDLGGPAPAEDDAPEERMSEELVDDGLGEKIEADWLQQRDGVFEAMDREVRQAIARALRGNREA